MKAGALGRPLAAALTAGLAACGSVEPPPRIVLLIADGAGAAHWTLATFAKEDLATARLGTAGLVDTRGADHTVSGSAPTATAYATGVRSFMGAVGVGPDSMPAESVVEAAIARGMSTGLMTTTFLADATPAAFGAHSPTRGAVPEIAREMSTKGITVLMGGGRSAYAPDVQPDSADLLAELRSSYTYVSSIEELRDLDTDTVGSLLGLFAEVGMGVVAERGSGTLREMTETALAILDRNPNGFFLMVENEESDTQSHANADQATITAEMLDFDEAVAAAVAYQVARPGTLVIVTGDHETGGLSLLPQAESRQLLVQYAWRGHTGTLIPLFADGPGAEHFSGIIRNDEVGRILLELVRGEED